jgi:hypothetical protein
VWIGSLFGRSGSFLARQRIARFGLIVFDEIDDLFLLGPGVVHEGLELDQGGASGLEFTAFGIDLSCELL